MSNLQIELPLEISGEEAKLFLAIKLFELGKLSAGKAAEFAGYSKPTFLEILGKYQIPIFNYTPEEFQKELSLWKKL